MDKYTSGYFMPGYTGHIPDKINTMGETVGSLNRRLVLKQTPETELGITQRTMYDPRFGQLANKQIDNLKYGFRSRDGVNWICGPTDELHAQHVPGYQGHVPGINSENLFAKSFARTTKTAIGTKLHRGADVPPNLRFTSMQQHFYNTKKNRRHYENPNLMKVKRDEQNFLELGGLTNTPGSAQGGPFSQTMSAARLSMTGMSCGANEADTLGATGRYKPKPTTSMGTRAGEDTYFDFSGTQTRWNNVPLVTTPAFQTLSPSYQKVVAQNAMEENVKLPVVGYSGFKSGYKSQNFFGKSFRECAVQSKNMQILTHKKGPSSQY